VNEVVERRRKGEVKGGSEGEDEEVGEKRGRNVRRGKRGKEGGGRRERAVNRW